MLGEGRTGEIEASLPERRLRTSRGPRTFIRAFCGSKPELLPCLQIGGKPTGPRQGPKPAPAIGNLRSRDPFEDNGQNDEKWATQHTAQNGAQPHRPFQSFTLSAVVVFLLGRTKAKIQPANSFLKRAAQQFRAQRLRKLLPDRSGNAANVGASQEHLERGLEVLPGLPRECSLGCLKSPFSLSVHRRHAVRSQSQRLLEKKGMVR